jgi:hypothetical protein
MMANYSFADDLKNVSLMDSGNFQKTDEDVRNDVMRKVKRAEPADRAEAGDGAAHQYTRHVGEFTSRGGLFGDQSACPVIPSTCTSLRTAETKASKSSGPWLVASKNVLASQNLCAA